MQDNPNKTISRFFSGETLQAKREWQDMFRVLKEKTANQDYCIQQSYPSEL